jgi:hypothetical protein
MYITGQLGFDLRVILERRQTGTNPSAYAKKLSHQPAC